MRGGGLLQDGAPRRADRPRELGGNGGCPEYAEGAGAGGLEVRRDGRGRRAMGV